MKKEIPKHEDEGFIQGMTRYLNIDLVLESNSWDELFEKVKVFERDGFKIQSFREYKALNIALNIEQNLITILDLLRKEDRTKNDLVKIKILNAIKRHRRVSTQEAVLIIQEQTENKEDRLINPHILVFVAGMGMGELIDLFNSGTHEFPSKNGLVKDLREFKEARNDLTHNLLSSRVDISTVLNTAIETGLRVGKNLESMMHMVQINKDGRLVSELKIKFPQIYSSISVPDL